MTIGLPLAIVVASVSTLASACAGVNRPTDQPQTKTFVAYDVYNPTACPAAAYTSNGIVTPSGVVPWVIGTVPSGGSMTFYVLDGNSLFVSSVKADGTDCTGAQPVRVRRLPPDSASS